MVGRLWLMPMKLGSTYNVARTSMTVRLTWITMVRYWLVNMLIIWLRNSNIPVGRVTCSLILR